MGLHFHPITLPRLTQGISTQPIAQPCKAHVEFLYEIQFYLIKNEATIRDNCMFNNIKISLTMVINHNKLA